MERLIVLFTLIFTCSTHAIIIPSSLNDDAPTGLIAYLGDDDGWPTPQQDPNKFPVLPEPQSTFTPYDPIRFVTSILLAPLNKEEDNSPSHLGGDDNLYFQVDWYNPALDYVNSNFLWISWPEIEELQASAGDSSQLTLWTDTFITDTYGPLDEGNWTAFSYFEGEFYDFAEFTVAVPEPSTFALLLLSLFGLGVNRRRFSLKS